MEIFSFDIYQINKKITQTDIQIVFRGKIRIDLLTKLPKEYKKFADLFSFIESNNLPPHQTNNHAINLKSGTSFVNGLFYGMFENELLVPKNYFEKIWKKVSSEQVFPQFFFQFCLQKNWGEDCFFVWIIENSMRSQLKTVTQYHWSKKPWTDSAKLNVILKSTL